MLTPTVLSDRYVYTGPRDDADKLITWLMNKGWWIEISANRNAGKDHFDVTCGVKPSDVPAKTLRLRIAECALIDLKS